MTLPPRTLPGYSPSLRPPVHSDPRSSSQECPAPVGPRPPPHRRLPTDDTYYPRVPPSSLYTSLSLLSQLGTRTPPPVPPRPLYPEYPPFSFPLPLHAPDLTPCTRLPALASLPCVPTDWKSRQGTGPAHCPEVLGLGWRTHTESHRNVVVLSKS